MSEAQILIRDKTGDHVDELDVYTQFDGIDRDLDAGSWSIQAPTSDKTELLATPGYGLIVKLDDEEFIAGSTTTVEDSWKGDEATTTISGLGDDSRLWEYLCYPCAPPFTALAYDAQNGVGETVMKHYVSNNLQDTTRKPPLTPAIAIAPDLARGTSAKVQARFETVGDKLVSIGTTTGLGFQVKDLTFDVFARVDRSADQLFSRESGNLIEFKRKTARPTANRIICAGSGDGTARAFRIGSDSISAVEWGAYIEFFRDRRDTSDATQLQQSIDEELTKGAEKTELTLRTIDLPERTYRKDWNLGDIVTAQGIVGTVKQVQLTLNDKGQVIVPSVSSASTVAASAILKAYDELRSQRRRIAYLERTK